MQLSLCLSVGSILTTVVDLHGAEVVEYRAGQALLGVLRELSSVGLVMSWVLDEEVELARLGYELARSVRERRNVGEAEERGRAYFVRKDEHGARWTRVERALVELATEVEAGQTDLLDALGGSSSPSAKRKARSPRPHPVDRIERAPSPTRPRRALNPRSPPPRPTPSVGTGFASPLGPIERLVAGSPAV